VGKAGLSDKIAVDSAGTSSGNVGSPAHPGTLGILNKYGIKDYHGRSRQITHNDLSEYDYVLAMDRDNLAFILRYALGAKADVRLFLSYAQDAGLVEIEEVPDPYYDGNYQQTYDLVERGSRALLDHIRHAQKI
ncbi:MAG: low molecular weight phosphotyrosine protein phosphatase, partial [Chloroflexota bacterium]